MSEAATLEDTGATPPAGGPSKRSFEDVWAAPTGFASLTSVSHRVVGKRYVVTGFVFFLIAGIFALLLRLQLAFPDNQFLSAQTYNELFTLHGTVMMFLFAIPILEGAAIYLIPLLIGARDLVFPRLGAYSYFCYVLGGVFLLSGFLFDAVPDGGWFMYTPLSGTEYSPGRGADFWLIGITFAEISSVSAAVELIAGILCTRAPGMSLTRMPIFCWYILVTAFMIAVGFPPLIIGSILLELQRAVGFPFFDPSLGGDPLLWQHLFWIFGHPEVYIIFLPAAGMVSTILPTFVGRPLFGYGFIVASLVTMGFLSFGLWVHHMFATGLPQLSLAYFSGASMAVTLPTSIQIFCWIATLWGGKPRLQTPMLFILGFFFVFILGGLTGVMVAAVPFDWQATDTYFIVAHLHYVLIGGMVFPLMAGLYYWVPHVTGKLLNKRLGFAAFWLIFLGFNISFLPMHLTGLLGMPRRVATYPSGFGWDMLNMVSTVGSFMLAAGFLVFLVDIFTHTRFGRAAGRNPWGAATLEWLYPAVTPGYNFRTIPDIRSREPLWDQPELAGDPKEAGPYLEVHNDQRRETMGCDPVSGEPIQIVRLPHPTWIPLLAALATGVVFGGLLSGVYWLSGIGVVLTTAMMVAWHWEPSSRGSDYDIGDGRVRPVDIVDKRSHSHVALQGTVLVMGALFLSLVFAYFFLWTSGSHFIPAATPLEPISGLIAGALAAGLFAFSFVCPALGAARAAPYTYVCGAILAGVLGAALLGMVTELSPRCSAHDAVAFAILAFLLLHVFILVVWASFVCFRAARGQLAPAMSLPVLNGALLAKAVAVMTLLGLATLVLAPMGLPLEAAP